MGFSTKVRSGVTARSNGRVWVWGVRIRASVRVKVKSGVRGMSGFRVQGHELRVRAKSRALPEVRAKVGRSG